MFSIPSIIFVSIISLSNPNYLMKVLFVQDYDRVMVVLRFGLPTKAYYYTLKYSIDNYLDKK